MTWVEDKSAALTRGTTYRWLAQFIEHGPGPEQASFLADVLKEAPDLEDEDAMGALHHRIFGYEISCHEGVFRSTAGLVGGMRADQVTGAYQAVGFQPQNGLSHDNLGAELQFLSVLSMGEHRASLDGDSEEVSRMRELQALFLDQHLLCWLSACSAAVKGCGEPLYGKIAEVMVGITADHRQSLLTDHQVSSPPLGPVDVPDLDAAQTGLDEVVEYLVIPARCGLFIGHSHMVGIGHHLSLPCGFGSRRQVLRNLFDAAVRYEREALFFQAVQELAGEHRVLFETWGQEFKVLNSYHAPWIVQMEATAELMSVMEGAVMEKNRGEGD